MKKLIWKLAGRFLTRRLAKKAVKYARENEEDEDFDWFDLDQFKVAIGGNPGLHSIIMLRGKHFRHYLLSEDLVHVFEAAKDEPEIKCKWN